MWHALVLAYALSFTAVPDAATLVYSGPGYGEIASENGSSLLQGTGPYYLELSARISWGLIYAGGSVTVETSPMGRFSWDATGTRYSVSGGLLWRGVEISVEHWCQHPQITYGPRWEELGVQRLPAFEGGQTQISIRLAGETTLLNQ